ncbi:hypothetical protein FB565_000567 [Actinoplanes lutulentus]|uniref:Uncharacterized protein n=1 Tax=Actinoplanes lutulentus TaxID=1287878 RepID=A0A327ZJZ8_9ACTN|nr:hypothetical protein [Actinoplanes lutulentus]RAK43172.1 hypothetical protein B0I29_101302 [Actinoplanes lutulentus]
MFAYYYNNLVLRYLESHRGGGRCKGGGGGGGEVRRGSGRGEAEWWQGEVVRFAGHTPLRV